MRLSLLIIKRPKVRAFRTIVLHDIACCYNQCDVFLSDHTPDVLNCVFERALTCNDFTIAWGPAGPIDKVCVDVAADEIIRSLEGLAWQQSHSAVLIRQDIDVAILFLQPIVRERSNSLPGQVLSTIFRFQDYHTSFFPREVRKIL